MTEIDTGGEISFLLTRYLFCPSYNSTGRSPRGRVDLAPDMVWSTPDQLWRADVTLARGVFLAVILGRCSRRVIGWRWSARGKTS